MSQCSRECGWSIGFPFAASIPQRARQLAARAPEVDLKSQSVEMRLAFDDPVEWRVGDQAPIPVLLAFDLDGRETWRQRAARHDMVWSDHMRLGIEIDEVATSHVDRANA